MTPPQKSPARAAPWLRCAARVAALLVGLAAAARAEVQFDVFVGYDEHIREAAWFPVVFEVQNTGSAFTATIEFGPDGGLRGHPRRLVVELPTGTRKRLTLPAFATGGRFTRWEARLLDEKGAVRHERAGIEGKDRPWDVPLLGSVARTFSGVPTLPDPRGRAPELVPAVARVDAAMFPADPLTLEGLDAIYLHAERAPDFRPEQADALLAWLQGGGHLVVGLEQPGDLAAVPWLAAVSPFAPRELVELPAATAALDDWLRRPTGLTRAEMPEGDRLFPGQRRARPRGERADPPALQPVEPFLELEADAGFRGAVLPVMRGEVRGGGEVLVATDGVPLAVQGRAGRGKVTVLAFPAEREPFRTWAQRPWFWARLTEVPPERLLPEAGSFRRGTTPMDGLFGAMIDSRQVRKLPVGVLLALLVVYLAVIGPVDRYVLKRLKREVWTWVTFPAYVLLFSGLIYTIGYRLRAGETEWNELQVVDLLPRPEGAVWRGRTFGSIYSPANERYRLASDQPFASLRGEFQGGAGAGEAGRLVVQQGGWGFAAETFVPVWVNQLVASDWLQPGAALLEATVSRGGDGVLEAVVRNRSGVRLSDVRLVTDGQVFLLGGLAAGEEARRTLARSDAVSLELAVSGTLPEASFAAHQRRQAFGRQESGRLD
ncbi:MAG TPA: hypothetical protein PKE47_04315, partial [Verrucomicrobiota bacterium]|nr:hypothetical protein [Verrucomicrobiota bacterium]